MDRSKRTAIVALSVALCCATAGCATAHGTGSGGTSAEAAIDESMLREAIFAGGCFWCIESAYDGVAGVVEAVSGYTGGSAASAEYARVSSGRTEHLEAVLVRYDPSVIDYETLVQIFWRRIDPTDAGGQFADRGRQYETAIFVGDDAERGIAERTRRELAASGRFDGPIVTPVVAAGPFYPAEEYHQDYARKNPAHYKRYAYGSGREPFLKKIWGDEPLPRPKAKPWASFQKPPASELQRRLTPQQFHVTQEDGTERPFANEYWNHEGRGIYVDVVSGEPLFGSRDKFKSGTGWPSFVRPLRDEQIVEKVDTSLGMRRVEVRSALGDSHLGHLFEDGPQPTGLRYCINSASLRFVPVERLEDEGYGEFAPLFDDAAPAGAGD